MKFVRKKHVPFAVWEKYNEGAYHVYGHIHAQTDGCYSFLKNEERALNAGCMINRYMPVTMHQLIENNRVYRSC